MPLDLAAKAASYDTFPGNTCPSCQRQGTVEHMFTIKTSIPSTAWRCNTCQSRIYKGNSQAAHILLQLTKPEARQTSDDLPFYFIVGPVKDCNPVLANPSQ